MLKRLAKSLSTRFSTAIELLKGLWQGPYWWLVPLLCVLLPTAVIFVFLQAVPVVAPFVYSVF